MGRKSDIAPLICYCSAYLVILLYHTRRQVRMYSAKFSKNKVCLFIHIGTGVMELSRYHISKARYGNDNILPEVIDVLSCFIWSWTSLVLVKTLRRGDPRTTRPPYQTGALLRPVISTIAYLLQLPSLHRVSICALDSFLYARLGIFFFTYTPYLRGYSSSTFYSISIPLSAVISIHESGVRGASLVFILAMACVSKLNEWVTHRSRLVQGSEARLYMAKLEKCLLAGLIYFGFADLDRLREVSKSEALMKPLNDEYVPKLERNI
ncbi:hypothetical protein N7455_007102 [Penicillium solitum]|uniref:uncharacterized protein n=1 Tax=Penicillium solitum TaxID=60172 RepID=UPI0017C43654|nr:hypothetical protein HAV15_013026 [Penicillium sp. str. \